MRTTGIKFEMALALAAMSIAAAAAPAGRFEQDIPGGYLDLKIQKDGKRAHWITKDCVRCKTVMSKMSYILDKDGGFEFEGKMYFVESPTKLFHPSMGTFVKKEVPVENKNP